jgi:1-acyl-sn-glycerol-3-phosphate acyltransferase
MKRFLYVLYTWLIFTPVFLVLTLVTALTVIAGCLLGGEKIFAYYPGMIWSRLTCYLAFCPVKVSGKEHIDRKRSYVFVANHQGAFDIFLIYGFLGVPIKWVMKAGIAKIPFVGAACRAAGFIFVDHSTPQRAVRSMLEANRCLKKGVSIVVFPEGSRTYTGKMDRFKKGAYRVAVEHRLPVIPITLNGPFYVLPIGSLKLRPHRMEMIIHPLVSTEGVSPKELSQIAARTQDMIASDLWDEFR